MSNNFTYGLILLLIESLEADVDNPDGWAKEALAILHVRLEKHDDRKWRVEE